MKLSSIFVAVSATLAVVGAFPHSGTLPKISLERDEGDDFVRTSNPLGVQKVTAEDNEPQNPDETYALLSFYMSVSMIVVSEIGDKTFLIAALMAMKHLRIVVFSAAFLSLAVMTVLLGVVGHALPSLISRRLTQFMAAVLFIVFGVKLLREGLAMSKSLGVDEEMAEVEEELANNAHAGGHDLESAGDQVQLKKLVLQEFASQINDLASFVLSPVWIQVFVMTFLGEWGDRSQIATIAMAAGLDYWVVILGATIGHGLCTAAACIGGQLLATRISMRTVTLGGSAAFFVFSVLYFYDFYTFEEAV